MAKVEQNQSRHEVPAGVNIFIMHTPTQMYREAGKKVLDHRLKNTSPADAEISVAKPGFSFPW